jgi:His/Glu/Gln/Arg/opine family amino acid ABC transporter permease subunit
MTVGEMTVAMLGGLGSSLLLTVSALLIGALIGVPIAAARGSQLRIIRVLGTAYIEIVRGIPPIAWLFLLFFGLTQFGIRMMNMTAAIIGLGIVAGAYMAEIYRSSLAALPSGQYEASRALALGRWTSFFSVTLPQAAVTGLPQSVAFAIGLLKDSAIASVIGVGGVTTIALMLSRRSLDALTIFLICGLVYMLVSVPTSFFGRWLGDRLARRMGVVR